MTRHARKFLALALVALVCVSDPANRVKAEAGDLDPGFGAGGKVTTDFSGGLDDANAVVIQPDGRIVAVGRHTTATDVEGLAGDFALARYNADGSLDSGFGTNGRVVTDFGGADAARSVALQPDGKIVAAGITSGALALARYNADGSLDAGFGPNADGKVVAASLDGAGVVLQSDGKIVVAGTSNFDFGLARFNTDGSTDITFGLGFSGRVATDFGRTDFASALVIDADGKFVVAGLAQNNTGVYRFAVARYNPNGSPDAGFGSNGTVLTVIGSQSFARALAIQPNGKIIAAGSFSDFAGLSGFALARYNTNGSLDTTFGNGGVATTVRPGAEANAVAIQADGRIVAAGLSRWVLVGYNANGSPDLRFGPNGDGVLVTDLGGSARAHALAIQSNNMVIVAGGRTDFALARYDLTHTNRVAVIDVAANNTSTAGERFTRFGSFTDPDSASWTATVDYGDGTGIRTLPLTDQAFVLNHVYAAAGTYTITVCVTDDGGLSACGTVGVVVTAAVAGGAPSCVADVPGQFRALKHHPEALGFYLGDGTPEPTLFRHYQGMQRLPGPGTPYFFVSRSGNNAGIQDPAFGDDPGNLLVVKFNSRNTTGERLRSNRLRTGTDTEDTAPPTRNRLPEDYVVKNINFDGGPITPPRDHNWPAYGHAGGMQIFEDILLIPLTFPEARGLPSTMLVLADISNPEVPVVHKRLELRTPDGVLEDIGVVAITRRFDGLLLLLVTGGGNETLEVFESNVTDIHDENLRFIHLSTWFAGELAGGEWPTGHGGHQTLFLVHGCGDAIYMLGTRNTAGGSLFPGNEDWTDLYRVSLDSTGHLNVSQIESKHMFCESHEVGLTCDFAAASAFHVTPAGELILYASEHENGGPDDTVRMAEFHSDRLFRAASPNWAPTARAGGPYRVNAGDSIVLNASASTPPVAQAWVELYEDENFEDRSVVMDWADQYEDDYNELGHLDDFSDQADSLVFAAPDGCDLHLYEDPHYRDRELVLAGNGSVQRIGNLNEAPYNFGDVIDSMQFLGSTCDARALRYFWDLDDDGVFETTGMTTTVHPSAAMRISLRVCSDFFRCDEDFTIVEVLDITPKITSFNVPSPANEGTEIAATGSFTNPANRTLTVTVDWGDGAIDSAPRSQILSRHTYVDDGSYPVRVEVCDPDRRCDARTTTVVVANVAPTVRIDAIRDEAGRLIGPSDVVLAGLRVDLSGSFGDAGIRDTHTATINWGEGANVAALVNQGARTVSGSHVYAASSTPVYVIRLSVMDDDGGIGPAARPLIVVDPTGAIGKVVQDLNALASRPGVSAAARRKLQSAVDDLQGNNSGDAHNGAIDKLASGDLNAALVKIGKALKSLDEAGAAAPSLDLIGVKTLLALTAKAIALDALARAQTATPADPTAVAKAATSIAEGDALLAAGNQIDAVDKYRDAIQRIQHLL